jgi:hypothetical protein
MRNSIFGTAMTRLAYNGQLHDPSAARQRSHGFVPPNEARIALDAWAPVEFVQQ